MTTKVIFAGTFKCVECGYFSSDNLEFCHFTDAFMAYYGRSGCWVCHGCRGAFEEKLIDKITEKGGLDKDDKQET